VRILAIEQELKPLDGVTSRDLLREEAARVWALKKDDVIREIWFTRRGRSAVLMLECETEADASRYLASLPLVREHYIRFDVQALQPYDGFDRLIGAGAAGSSDLRPAASTGPDPDWADR
jgi:hypothetical protein